MGIIYKLTSPSGKGYIGQTVGTLVDRLKNHNKKSSTCKLIKRAINKYGFDTFKVETLLRCEEKDLDLYEQNMISVWNTLAPYGYNCTSGGESRKKLSEKTKIAISTSLKKAHKNGIFISHKKDNHTAVQHTQPHSQETKALISEINTGKKGKKDAMGGVTLCKQTGRFRARIPKVWNPECTNKNRCIGVYDTREEAREALQDFKDNKLTDVLQNGTLDMNQRLRRTEDKARMQGSVGVTRNGTFRAVIPKSWSEDFKEKTIGTFKTRELAKDALKEYKAQLLQV